MATILIVDDRPDNRELLVTILGYREHRLLQAGDGVEALHIARAERPDLIISDILMPTMDGFEFVHQLRAEPGISQTKVIFYTADYLKHEAQGLAQSCGVVHVLTKPAEPEAIYEAVDTALGITTNPIQMPPAAPEFNREHLSIVTNKLASQSEELRSVEKSRIEALMESEKSIRKLNEELEQRVLERTGQLEAANKELEAANKELESFSYSVSHDLRSPLRAIDGFTRIVLEEHSTAMATEGKAYLEMVRASTRKMGTLVDDLLAFSRLGRLGLTKQTVNSAQVVRSCQVELSKELEGRKPEIVIGDLPSCQADPALLKQVWINLLSNAIKYTSKTVGARIEIGSQASPRPSSAGMGFPLKDETIFFIKDNGAGFDMKYASKLFGVFQRLHRDADYEGTGVGLAIAQRIINRHGGRIWGEAQLKQGATFSFTLA